MENWTITHWDKPVTWPEAQSILTGLAAQKSPYQASMIAYLEAKADLIKCAKGGDKQAARVLREHTGLEFSKKA